MRNHVFGMGSGASTTATNYTALGAHHKTPNTTAEGTPFQFAGTLSKLRINAAAPGSGASWTITVQKDTGSGFTDTAMVLTLSGTSTTAVTTANPVAFNAGDSLRVKIVPSASPAPADMSGRVGFAAQIDTTGPISVIAGDTEVDPSATATQYFNLAGGSPSYGGTEADMRGMCKAAGTLKNLIVETRVAPGSGKSWQFTVFKNGSATALTCTISDTATRASDTSDSIALAKDDVLSLRCVPSGTPATSGHGWSCEFDPTTNGEQPVLSGINVGHQSGYAQTPGFFASATTENYAAGLLLCGDVTLKDWGGTLQTAPGSGKSWTFTLRKVATADTTAAFTISDTNTSGEQTSDPTFVEGDNFNVLISSSGAPLGCPLASGCVLYIPPAMTGAQIPLVMARRYSCLSGADTFYTEAIDVTAYASVSLCVWRAPLLGTSPTFALTLQESIDQVTWSTLSGSTSGADPGADSEVLYSGALTKRWLRAKCVLGGTSPVATWSAEGYLELREDALAPSYGEAGAQDFNPSADTGLDLSQPLMPTEFDSQTPFPTGLDAMAGAACSCQPHGGGGGSSGCGCSAPTTELRPPDM